jgi:Fe-S cluster assembly iron-binding protein IscA
MQKILVHYKQEIEWDNMITKYKITTEIEWDNMITKYKITTETEIIDSFNLAYIESFDLPYTSDQVEDEIMINNVNYQDLLIYNFIYTPINSVEQLSQIDFTILGLTSETPTYARKGIKNKAEYTHNGKIIVSKYFKYSNSGVTIKINYHLENGEIGYFKEEFKPLNIVEMAKIQKANRDRSITFLQASAIGTPIETFVNELLKRYKSEVELFIQNNTIDFENRLNSESFQPYLTYLNIVVEAPDLTVKKAILRQISQND